MQRHCWCSGHMSHTTDMTQAQAFEQEECSATATHRKLEMHFAVGQ